VKRRAAVFLDRDGTLTLPRHYPCRPEHLVLQKGVPAALRELRAAGWLLVVVTNQSGLARGYFTPADLEAMHAHLRARLAAAGAGVDAIYHCPHHPDGVVAELAIRCACRKPATGMLLAAATDLGIDLAGSWMVGDAPSDIEAGRRAGCRTVRVDGTAPTDPDGGADRGSRADHVAASTEAALRHIVRSERVRGELVRGERE
jgi:D-glycero-D-manno-heptose 1,7-bisphosphate phosphatase